MNQLVPIASPTDMPSLFHARPAARARLRDFFKSHIRNPSTRRAYREAVRMLIDWMVVGQVLPVNPAHAVRGPKHTNCRSDEISLDEVERIGI